MIAVTLLSTVLVLALPVWHQARYVVLRALKHSYRSIRSTTFEQRRLVFYGDCDKHAYGYVKRMTQGFPEANAVPVLRNPEWDPGIASVMLPGFRPVTEPRMLIAAGIPAAEMSERQVASARRLGRADRDGDAWQFTTGRDVDLLTGFEFTLAERPPAGSASLTVVLFHSAEFPIVMGAWTVRGGSQDTGELVLRLPQPLEGFSLGRGAMPFMLKVTTPDGSSVDAIRVLGLLVDLRNHVIVNRERGCFTAVRRDLLAEIGRTANHSWAGYVATIRNVPVD